MKKTRQFDNKIKYEKELHHTCNNHLICKAKIHPDETCKNCTHYKMIEVDVAQEPIREKFEWDF